MMLSEKLLGRAVKLRPSQETELCKGVGEVVLVAYPITGLRVVVEWSNGTLSEQRVSEIVMASESEG